MNIRLETAGDRTTAANMSADNDDLFLACRYGDIEEIQQYVDQFGPALLSTVRDQNENTILHMICGNGHVGKFSFISTRLSNKF
jgi:hypothetical protein